MQLLYSPDSRDTFEVRGQSRSKRGELAAAHVGDRGAALRYQGLDAVSRNVVVSFSEIPQRLIGSGAEFEVLLPSGGRWDLYVEVAASQTWPSRQRFRAVRRRRVAACVCAAAGGRGCMCRTACFKPGSTSPKLTWPCWWRLKRVPRHCACTSRGQCRRPRRSTQVTSSARWRVGPQARQLFRLGSQ
ncbi:MAG: hypothetical protein EOP82_18665 [Variovorax sp.]|nr:MAG: hypothetical protein EOP82_18665 [Variovorax sp.]